MEDLVKMSEKGQLVVPQHVRLASKLNPGERFIAFPVKDGVFFKKVDIPDVKAEFELLAKEVQTRFKKLGVKKSDIKKAMKK